MLHFFPLALQKRDQNKCIMNGRTQTHLESHFRDQKKVKNEAKKAGFRLFSIFLHVRSEKHRVYF